MLDKQQRQIIHVTIISAFNYEKSTADFLDAEGSSSRSLNRLFRNLIMDTAPTARFLPALLIECNGVDRPQKYHLD